MTRDDTFDDQPRRLHWGCGSRIARGWINADRHALPGVDLVGDIADGLALPDASVDCIVAMHVLQDLPWPELAHALAELRRVLRPGGVLRLGCPISTARSKPTASAARPTSTCPTPTRVRSARSS